LRIYLLLEEESFRESFYLHGISFEGDY